MGYANPALYIRSIKRKLRKTLRNIVDIIRGFVKPSATTKNAIIRGIYHIQGRKTDNSAYSVYVSVRNDEELRQLMERIATAGLYLMWVRKVSPEEICGSEASSIVFYADD